MNLFKIIGVGMKRIPGWFGRLTLVKKLLVMAVVLLGLWGIYSVTHKKTVTPQYQTAQVERGSLISSVTASGSVSSANSVSITTSASGVVNEVLVSNGDTVTAGQNIATLTLDQSSQQRQAAALASYQSAQNSLNAAKSKMNSLQSTLFKANQDFVTDAGTANPDTADPKYIEEKADWLQAESDYNNQAGVIAQAQTALSSAWLSYQQTSGTITAPMSGVITNLTLTQGSAITGGSNANSSSSNSSSNASSSTQSLGTISLQGGNPQATVNLSEIDITKIKVGQKVTMTLDAFPDKTFTGRVTGIDTAGSVSSGVTTYPTTISFDTNVDNIYANMTVSATIITSVKNDVLLVPSSAVQTQNGVSTVRVLKNGQIQQVTVEAGDSSDTQTEITSGLSEGDEVVTSIIPTGTGTGTTGAGASPFGGTGFGGGRGGFGGGGAGGRTIQRVRIGG